MNDCIFCKIAAQEIPSEKVYENERFFAFLDIKPINPGHTLVIPKNHSRNLLEADEATLHELMPFVAKLARAVKIASGADGINIGINTEPAAGQVVFHTHIHIIPRFSDDGYHMWGGRDYEGKGDAKEMARKIAEVIEK